MNYLNISQVLAIHSEVIEQTGGSRGIRDIGLVMSDNNSSPLATIIIPQ